MIQDIIWMKILVRIIFSNFVTKLKHKELATSCCPATWKIWNTQGTLFASGKT